MGKLIMWNIITVDGYFEGEEPWALPWHQLVWNQELDAFSDEQLQSAGALLLGRMTYEGMHSYWRKETGVTADRMNAIQKLVVSRTLDCVEWNNTQLLKGDIVQEIRSTKSESEKDIYVFGSANLLRTLIEENPIDEYRICVAPQLHGSGRRLFEMEMPKNDLSLSQVRQIGNGSVLLIYRPVERKNRA